MPWKQQLTNLPDELLLEIASYLDAKSLLTLSASCKRWRSTANDLTLWKQFLTDLQDVNSIISPAIALFVHSREKYTDLLSIMPKDVESPSYLSEREVYKFAEALESGPNKAILGLNYSHFRKVLLSQRGASLGHLKRLGVKFKQIAFFILQDSELRQVFLDAKIIGIAHLTDIGIAHADIALFILTEPELKNVFLQKHKKSGLVYIKKMACAHVEVALHVLKDNGIRQLFLSNGKQGDVYLGEIAANHDIMDKNDMIFNSCHIKQSMSQMIHAISNKQKAINDVKNDVVSDEAIQVEPNALRF